MECFEYLKRNRKSIDKTGEKDGQQRAEKKGR